MNAVLTGVPDFVAGAVVWKCWTVRFGEQPLATSLEWRSECRRYAAGRNVRTFWSSANGRLIGDEFDSLKEAMQASVNAGMRMVAA